MNEKPASYDHDHAARTRAALDAREAARAGMDLRPGRRVTLRVVTRCLNHAVAGRLVTGPGECVLENVHADDVPSFLREVETATQADLDRVVAEHRARITDRDDARRRGEPYRQHTTYESCFRAVMRRDALPFTSVEVFDPEPEPTTAKRGARA